MDHVAHCIRCFSQPRLWLLAVGSWQHVLDHLTASVWDAHLALLTEDTCVKCKREATWKTCSCCCSCCQAGASRCECFLWFQNAWNQVLAVGDSCGSGTGASSRFLASGSQRTVSTTLGVIVKVLTVISDDPVCFRSARYCVNHFILFLSLNHRNDPLGGGLLLLSSWIILSPWWRNQSLGRPRSLGW